MENRYEETTYILNNMAAAKMQMNAHKGKIEEAQLGTLMELMKDEVDELDSAICNDKGIMCILEEASDIMNYLVAVTHQQIQAYRVRKDKK
jgi:hypothetical protein